MKAPPLFPVFLLLTSILASPPQDPKEVDPDRRKSERAVKGILDPALQQQVDRAIATAKKYLLSLRSLKEAKPIPNSLTEELRSEARRLRKESQGYTNGKQKKEAERKAQALLRCAEALEAGRAPEEDDRKFLKIPAATPPPSSISPFGPGGEALVGLALIQSGVPPSDPVVTEIWKRQAGKPIVDSPDSTYTAAVQLMFADVMMHAPCGEAWPSPDSKKAVLDWIRQRAEALASGCDGGAWTYTWGKAAVRGYAVEEEWAIDSKPLLEASVPQGPYDFSNSQYAILGLKAAALCGIRPEGSERMWRIVLQQFLTAQEHEGPGVELRIAPEKARPGSLKSYEHGWENVESGDRQRKAWARGWGYVRSGMPTTHTMTAAGLTALLVARSELRLTPVESERVDEAVRDGLAWMQLRWEGNGLSGRGGAAGGGDLGGVVNSYLVYGLERMGVLGAIRKIGGHDWYAEGAKRLVETQGTDGSWNADAPGGYGPEIDTAFCLLFLCRGTREEFGKPSYEVGEFKGTPTP